MIMGFILEFKDQPAASVFAMTPETALEFFKAKGLQPTFSYLDMIREEHDVAFTVAKMLQVDLLHTTREAVNQAIAEGWSIGRFRKELGPKLQAAGWWGRGDILDPQTGALAQDAQLGSAHRLNTIYRSNLQSAYSVGQWERIQENAGDAPWLLYDAVDDHRTREAHARLDNTVLPVTDPFWDRFMPPNGYNCRCGVIQLSDADLERLGLKPSKKPKLEMVKWKNPRTGKIEEVPAAIDPGWDHNPGKARLESLQKLAAEKVNRLPPEWSAAAREAKTDWKTQRAQALAEQAFAAEQAAKAQARAKAIAEENAAQAQIDNALDQQTPYLAAAIKKVMAAKSNQSLTPKGILAKAHEVAETQKKNHALTKYKNAIVAGKTPADDVVAVFDALPADQKAKISEQIGQLQAKKAAENAIKAIAGESGVYAHALKKLQDSGQAEGMDVVDLLKAVMAAGDEQKAKISQGLKVANYKKAVIADKTPTPEQAAAFDALDEAKKAQILEEIEQAKAAKAPPPKPVESVPAETEINIGSLTQIGPQRGSNPGGLYQDTETGVKWYIKTPGSADNARNEVLAAKLYQAAGLEVPELQVIDWQGQTSIASKIVDGLEQGTPDRLARATGTGEGFVVDAWLANWDVVGLSYDNLLLRGSQVVRVDTGGALRYRAQGSMKGAAWGDTVGELETLRDPAMNAQSARVFAQITRDDLVAGARRVLAVSESDIRELVRRYGPENQAEADKLVATLLARQSDIARRFPDAATDRRAPPPADISDRVTKAELRTIQEARLNGYTIATDKDQIEDQEVLVWHERGDKGPVTAAVMKVRGNGAEAIERMLSSSDRSSVNVLGTIDERVLVAVKGIARYRLDEGLRDKDIQRAREALEEWDLVVARMERELSNGTIDAADVTRIRQHYQPWISALRTVADDTAIGKKGYWQPPAGNFAGTDNPARKTQSAPGLQLTKRRGVPFTVKQIRSGRAEDTGRTSNAPPTEFYETTLSDGTVVRYFANDNDYFALRGRLEIRAPGNTEASAARIFSALDELGINSARPEPGDAEELYLRQIAYARVQGWRQVETKLRGLDDQPARIQALREHLEQQIGTDPARLPGYNPTGQREAFGHGHRHLYRPDLQGPEWDRFRKDYRLHHAITDGGLVETIEAILNSGGKMAPSTDKLRRGIPLGGMSPEADLRSGGASYFFTRIKSRQAATQTPGFVWKSDLLARLDAISYDGDNYGRVTGDHVIQNRKSGVDQWREASRNSSNETIFKNSLSLFDQLDSIITGSASARQKVIQIFRDHGYSVFPDGRALEEVIK